MSSRYLAMLCLSVLVALGGCASKQRAEQFELVARAYERAMRWSEFDKAVAAARQQGGVVPDAKRMKDIRVLSYDKVDGPKPNAETTRIQQTIEIRYTDINKMNERTLTDQQTWLYSDVDGRWKLVSPFPTFP